MGSAVQTCKPWTRGAAAVRWQGLGQASLSAMGCTLSAMLGGGMCAAWRSAGVSQGTVVSRESHPTSNACLLFLFFFFFFSFQ